MKFEWVDESKIQKIQDNSDKWEELVQRVWEECNWTPARNHVDMFASAISKAGLIDGVVQLLATWRNMGYYSSTDADSVEDLIKDIEGLIHNV